MTKEINNHIAFILLFISFSPILGISQLSTKDSLLNIYSDSEVFTKLDREDQVDLLNNIANEYRFRAPDSLLYFVNESIAINEDKTYVEGYVRAIIRKGDYYSDQGENEVALIYYLKAKDLIEQINDKKTHVTLLKSLAVHHIFTGDFQEMLQNTYEAIEICEQNGFDQQQALMRHNLGWLYTNNKLHEEALTEYLVADSLWDITGDWEHKAGTQSNIALNAIETGNFDLALKNAEESRQYFEKTNDDLWHSRSSRVLGRYHYTIGELDSALFWTKKSDSLLSLLNNPRDQLEIYDWYSEIYFSLNNLDSAKSFASKMNQYAVRFKDTTKQLQSLDLLKNIWLKKGLVDSSLVYLKQFEELANQYRPDNENNLAFLRAKQEFDREQMIAETRIQNELARRKLLIAIALIILVALLAIILLIRKNYRQQRKTSEELKELNNAKDKVFSIMAHDLKSPMNTLKELLELYDQNDLSAEDVLKSTDYIRSNVDHSTFMLNNLLAWANNQMDGLTIIPASFAIKDKATQVVELYGSSIEKKQIKVTWVTNPAIRVHVDGDHLDLILRNLILNAIKFTPEGGEISFNGKVTGDRVIFEINDSGMGMSTKLVNAIMKGEAFNPMPGTKNEKGTGIGLQLTRELIELNNGKMSIESQPNSGTTIKLDFPKGL